MRALLGGEEGPDEEESPWWRTVRLGVQSWLYEFLQQNAYVLFLVALSVVRATGVTVKSGTTGLLFSFGRAKALVPPGFRVLIPFLQVVRIAPTRQRTLDLPAQRVTTLDGLVYFVDANLVYQITDVRKALIEIDDLIKGMRQVLVLSVQRVLRDTERASLRLRDELDRRLSEAMSVHLEPWGVEIVHAGFMTITPSPTTQQLVQLGARVDSRRQGLEILECGTRRPQALALLGTPQRVVTKTRILREREVERRRRRRVARVFRTVTTRRDLALAPRQRLTLERGLEAQAGLSGVLGEPGVGAQPRPTAAR